MEADEVMLGKAAVVLDSIGETRRGRRITGASNVSMYSVCASTRRERVATRSSGGIRRVGIAGRIISAVAVGWGGRGSGHCGRTICIKDRVCAGSGAAEQCAECSQCHAREASVGQDHSMSPECEQ